MEYPKFKVCVRCFTFNQSKYIEDAMNGFTMQQTDFPFVCCIVDDASTDGEQNVIKKYMDMHFDYSQNSVSFEKETDYADVLYAQHHVNKNCYFVIILLKENHYSQNKTKMQYLKEWRDICEYEAICEGDDYWIESNKLQEQVNYMQNHIDCSLCHTGFSFLQDVTGHLTPYIQNGNTDKEIIQRILNGNEYRVQTCTVMYRIKDYNKVVESDDFLYKSGYFLMGDTQLWIGLLLLGRIHLIKQNMAIYRINDGSSCRQNNNKQRFRFSLSCAELRLYIAQHINLDKMLVKNFKWDYYKQLIKYVTVDPDFAPLFKTPFYVRMWLKIITIPFFKKILLSRYM